VGIPGMALGMDFVGAKLGLVFKTAFLMVCGGRIFFAAFKRGDIEKFRGVLKLLEGKNRWIVRGVKAFWCRKRHPLEKADICNGFALVINLIGIPKRVYSSP
jgi:hypothetical protein